MIRITAALGILVLVLAFGVWGFWQQNQRLGEKLDAVQAEIAVRDQQIDRLKSIMEMTDNLNQANNAIRDLDHEIREDLKDAEGYSTPVPDELRRILERVR